MQQSTLPCPLYGAVPIVPPAPLQLNITAFPATSIHGETTEGFCLSPAPSSSPGESRMTSGADTSPAGHCFFQSSNGRSVSTSFSHFAASANTVNAQSTPRPFNSTSILPVESRSQFNNGESVEVSNGGDDTGGDDADFQSHEDSFYASLVVAQQLRRQRETTVTTSNRGSGGLDSKGTSTGDSQHHGSSQQHQSAADNLGPLSPLCFAPSHTSSTHSSRSVRSPALSDPPKTLHDLLAWRQGLIDARLKEHALITEQQQQKQQQQPQVRQDSAAYSWSLESGASPAVSSHDAPRSTLLAPRLLSPPYLALGPRQTSSASQTSSTRSSVHASRPYTAFPPPSPSSATTAEGSTRTEMWRGKTPLPLPLTHTPLLPPPHPMAASAPLTFQRTHCRREDELSASVAQMRAIGDCARLRDDVEGTASFGRLWIIALFFLLLCLAFEMPMFPGGMLGFFY